MKYRTAIAISSATLTQGCATTLQSVDLSAIKPSETAIYGNIIIVKEKYKSGALISRKEIPPERTYIAIARHDSIKDVPRFYLINNKAQLLKPKANGEVAAKIEPGRYYAITASISPESLTVTKDSYLHLDLTPGSSATGTVEINILPSITNYIGNIQITEKMEEYEDINRDGYITEPEFKSNITTFQKIAKGSDSFRENTYWISTYVSITSDPKFLQSNHTQNAAKYIAF